MLGVVEKILEVDEIEEMNINTLTTERNIERPDVVHILKEQEKFILENAQLNVPSEYKNRYLNLLMRNHEVISANKYNLGKCSTAMHDIELKSKEPIYIKQFRIPEAQRQALETLV